MSAILLQRICKFVSVTKDRITIFGVTKEQRARLCVGFDLSDWVKGNYKSFGQY